MHSTRLGAFCYEDVPTDDEGRTQTPLAVMPLAVLGDPDLSDRAKVLYALLSQPDGRIDRYPTNGIIADALGWSKRKVASAFRELMDWQENERFR